LIWLGRTRRVSLLANHCKVVVNVLSYAVLSQNLPGFMGFVVKQKNSGASSRCFWHVLPSCQKPLHVIVALHHLGARRPFKLWPELFARQWWQKLSKLMRAILGENFSVTSPRAPCQVVLGNVGICKHGIPHTLCRLFEAIPGLDAASPKNSGT